MVDVPVKRATQVGVIENLESKISWLARDEFPVQSNLSFKRKATDTTYGWLTQPKLTRTGDAGLVEGSDGPDASTEPRIKRYNKTQIFGEKYIISTTALATNVAGKVAEEKAQQRAIHTFALKEQIERAYSGNNPSRDDNGTVGRLSAGLESFIETNSYHPTGGSAGGWNNGTYDAPTDDPSNLRAYTEEQLQTAILDVYNQGGRAKFILMGPFAKQTFATFSGRGSATQEASKATIFANVDFYDSNFGRLEAIPSVYVRPNTVIVGDWNVIGEAVLTETREEERPGTALAKEFFIYTERCLVVTDERSLAGIHGVAGSADEVPEA